MPILEYGSCWDDLFKGEEKSIIKLSVILLKYILSNLMTAQNVHVIYDSII